MVAGFQISDTGGLDLCTNWLCKGVQRVCKGRRLVNLYTPLHTFAHPICAKLLPDISYEILQKETFTQLHTPKKFLTKFSLALALDTVIQTVNYVWDRIRACDVVQSSSLTLQATRGGGRGVTARRTLIITYYYRARRNRSAPPARFLSDAV